MPLLFPSIQDDNSLPKGGPADQFKPVVQWPHVEGVEVDLNAIRLQHGERHTHTHTHPVKQPGPYILQEKTPGPDYSTVPDTYLHVLFV